jgi:hypothetical protein
MARPDTTQNPQPPPFPKLSLPAARVSAWVVETRPDATRKWLAMLPLADSGQAAQQLYQALYTLNRMALDAGERLALMELYVAPVAVAATGLRSQFLHFAVPLKPRQKQLADFLLELQREMAYGYLHVIQGFAGERRPWEKGEFVVAAERAIRYLGETLLRAYHVYMPVPAGTWREIHGLYRYAEAYDCAATPLGDAGREASDTIARRYLQVLMLGLCGPYQLPQNECLQVDAFLERWAHKAELTSYLAGINPVGHFLVDLDTDHPATPFPRDVPLRDAPALRAVNAIELARAAHGFIGRLQKGEAPRALGLGFDCAGQACIDTLKRMLRFWGLAGRRHFSRRRLQQPLSLCVGLPAIHFFVSGQQPFLPPQPPAATAPDKAAQAPDQASLDAEARQPGVEQSNSGEFFRIDNRWVLRDESAGGLALARHADIGLPIRVGDLIGIHNPAADQWRIGAVRWVKSPDTQRVEMGVEMLAPQARPLAVRQGGDDKAGFSQALMLPPIEALRQPPTLLVPRGACYPNQEFELAEGALPPRRVRVLNILERTNAFAQVVFADVAQ